MDLRMPDLDGIEATRRITRSGSAPAVVVLTMFEDDDSVFAAMRAGARGYLLKGADQDEIVRAIRAAAAGEAIFGPEIAQRVIDHFASGSGRPPAAFPALTEREREVLEMVAAGKGQRGHRARTDDQPQDRAQPRLQHLHEAAGLRPLSGHRQGTASRARPQFSLMSTVGCRPRRRLTR